jgi:hypothetical protein
MALLKQVGHKGKRVKVWTGSRYYPLGASIWPVLSVQERVTIAENLRKLFGGEISPEFLRESSARAIAYVEDTEPVK